MLIIMNDTNLHYSTGINSLCCKKACIKIWEERCSHVLASQLWTVRACIVGLTQAGATAVVTLSTILTLVASTWQWWVACLTSTARTSVVARAIRAVLTRWGCGVVWCWAYIWRIQGMHLWCTYIITSLQELYDRYYASAYLTGCLLWHVIHTRTVWIDEHFLSVMCVCTYV